MNDRRKTPPHAFLHWEATTPGRIYFTQACPGGRVVDYSWAEVGRQARSIAAQLTLISIFS